MSFLSGLSRFFYGLLALLCIAVGMYFAVDNAQPVSPSFGGYTPLTGGVGVWLIGFLLLGFALGFVASLLPRFVERRRVRRLERQLRRAEQALQGLRRQLSGD